MALEPARFYPADSRTPLREVAVRWPEIDLLAASNDIHRPTEWHIYRPFPTVIVHLGGKMTLLETEVDRRGGSRGPALPGECWIIPAGQRYLSRAQGETIHYAELALGVQPLSGSRGEVESGVELEAKSAARDPFLYQGVLELLALSVEPSDLAQMQSVALSRTLFLHVQRNHGRTGAMPTHATVPAWIRYDQVRMRRLRDFIFDNLSENLRLEQLAHVAGQTVHQMLISFRATFGRTPWQYIIHERLRVAQRLLSATDKDITTIAFEAGFSSHSHLTRLFRQHLGCTPRTFREDHRRVFLPAILVE
ncbi:MAG TPA: AraC family transcriptional regulator [Opitutaceae bacterium]|nr:AraC family transcriptional regulator [Opitutaceae bacterium]